MLISCEFLRVVPEVMKLELRLTLLVLKCLDFSGQLLFPCLYCLCYLFEAVYVVYLIVSNHLSEVFEHFSNTDFPVYDLQGLLF